MNEPWEDLRNKILSLLAGVGVRIIPYSPMWALLEKTSKISTKIEPTENDNKELGILIKELSLLTSATESAIKSLFSVPSASSENL